MKIIDNMKIRYIAGNKTIGFCFLDIYENNGLTIAVVTEPEDNTGASITNAIEQVAGTIDKLGFDVDVLIEHYDIFDKEEWSSVKFQRTEYIEKTGDTEYIDPSWKHMTKEEFEKLIIGDTN